MFIHVFDILPHHLLHIKFVSRNMSNHLRNVSAPGPSLGYWIEDVTVVFFKFISSTRMFYRGDPGFAIDCPCGGRCRGLINYLLYVGPHFEYLGLINSSTVSLT